MFTSFVVFFRLQAASMIELTPDKLSLILPLEIIALEVSNL